MLPIKLVIFLLITCAVVETVCADERSPLATLGATARDLKPRTLSPVGDCNLTMVQEYTNAFANVDECISTDFPIVCKYECHEMYLGLAKHCMSDGLDTFYRTYCGKFNNSTCLNVLSPLASQSNVSEAFQVCVENDTVNCSCCSSKRC